MSKRTCNLALIVCTLTVSVGRVVPAEEPVCPTVERIHQAPDPRSDYGLAYDSRRGITVLFGGDGGNSIKSDTWEWDGTEWSLRARSGPLPRSRHAMAYDSRRGVTVLFGGASHGPIGDTWEWDGAEWVLRAIGGPSHRAGHVMAFDSARGVTVLFGGQGVDGEPLGDTWEWSGDLWSLRATGGLSPRVDAGAAFDPIRAVTVVFGGSTTTAPSTHSRETWEWDGARWRLKSTTGPSARSDHAMAFDSQKDVTLLYGGFATGLEQGLWEWDGATWRQRTPLGPGRRFGIGMVFDAQRQAAVVWGGMGMDLGGPLGDLWEGTEAEWVLLDAGVPRSGFRGNFVFDENRRATMLVGSFAPPHAETWEWVGQGWVSYGFQGTPPLQEYRLAFDSARGVSVLFGGTGWQGTSTSDTWEWDGSVWHHCADSGPPPTQYHALAYDARREVVVLFGGYTNEGFSGRTWEWDGTNWSLRANTGPLPRAHHALAYDPERGVTVLFGGGASETRYGDTWEWDGTNWTSRPGVGPTPRTNARAFYDPGLGGILLVGGSTSPPEPGPSMWLWDGTSWSNVTPNPTVPPSNLLGFDPFRRAFLYFCAEGLGSPFGLCEFALCPPDRDGDGVADDLDACLASQLSSTVAVGKCVTEVVNQVSADGCSLNDAILACSLAAENDRAFLHCVRTLTAEWRRDGIITWPERAAINRCAGRAPRRAR